MLHIVIVVRPDLDQQSIRRGVVAGVFPNQAEAGQRQKGLPSAAKEYKYKEEFYFKHCPEMNGVLNTTNPDSGEVVRQLSPFTLFSNHPPFLVALSSVPSPPPVTSGFVAATVKSTSHSKSRYGSERSNHS